MTGPLDPHSPLEAERITPARAPGSVRRTSSMQMLRPQGTPGPLLLVGRGRDLATPAGGAAPLLLAEASLTATVGRDGLLELLETEPVLPAPVALQNVAVGSGFRRALDAAWPDPRAHTAPLYLLLDELPVTRMITGYAIARDPRASASARRAATGIRPDVCSGWRSDGVIMLNQASGGGPLQPMGAPVELPTRPGDPHAWHRLDPLPPGSMRRIRRLDLSLGEWLEADAIVRDTFAEDGGSETVLHEYHVRARVDATTLVVEDIQASAGVLPSSDCPRAVDSAARIRGQHVAGLRRHVRDELRGVSTCTHLNDLLRCLADVEPLRDWLTGPR